MKISSLKYLGYALCVFSIFSFSACDQDLEGAIPQYDCIWRDSISLQFIGAMLYAPRYWCDPSVEEQFFFPNPPEDELLSDGIYNLFESYHEENPITLSWITSIYTKECKSLYPSAISDTKQLTQDDYHWRMQANDELHEVAHINSINNIGLADYKHQLVIQMYNVQALNGLTGTITWSETWLGETESFYTNNLWQFNCLPYGLLGTFTPDSDYPRWIYIHDHFEECYGL